MRPSHSLLLGLREDDHPQYFDQTRLDDYLTANPPVPAAHTHLEAEITDLQDYSLTGHTHAYLPLSGGQVDGAVTIDGATGPALKVRNADASGAQLRLVDDGDPNAVLLRNDGSTFYFLVTDTEDGIWNSLRPFYFSLSTGAVTIAEDATVSGTLNVNTIRGGSSLNLYGESNDSLRITSGETLEWWPSDTRRWYVDNTGNVTWINDATLRRNNGTVFMSAGASYTQLYDPAGTLKQWISTTAYYQNANTHYFRNTASTEIWKMSLASSIYRLDTGRSNTWVGMDSANNRWMMYIDNEIVLRLSKDAARFPQAYTDNVATGVANVSISSDGRLRRIVSPSAP